MSVFTPVGIILFSMFIMFFLQLIPGVFALFYHSLAGKFSKFKADHIAIFFIFGVETSIALLFFLIYSIINASTYVYDFFSSEIMRWILVGIFIALAFAFFFAYFRPLKTAKKLKTRKSQKSTTELFISQSFKTKYLAKIAKVKTRSDAFLLGFTAVIPELIFTLPLFVISILAIITLGATTINRALLILLFIFATILPLLILYVYFSNGNTIADFIRFRFKNKSFTRFFITFLYLLIALLIILEITL